jgi:HEAT repeat protein
MVETNFQTAVNEDGQSYVEAERQLIAFGQDAVPFLQQQLQGAPLVALIAQVLLEWINGNADFTECLEFLAEIEQRASRSAMGAPPIEWVIGTLRQKFEDRVAPLLGLYLIKLSREWVSWKTLSVIGYLGNLDSPAAATALIQYLMLNPAEYDRDIAAIALTEMGDREILAQLDQMDFPDSVSALFKEIAEQIRRKLENQTNV